MKKDTILRAFARIEVHLAGSPNDPDALRKREAFAARLVGKTRCSYFQSEIEASNHATWYRVWNRLIDGPSYIFEGRRMFYDIRGMADYRGALREEAFALHAVGKIVEVNFMGEKGEVREWKKWGEKGDWMVVLFDGNWWEHLGVTR